MIGVQAAIPMRYNLEKLGVATVVNVATVLRRAILGPRLPSWNLAMELAVAQGKAHLKRALSLGDAEEARKYLDALVSDAPVKWAVRVEAEPPLRGEWFRPKSGPVPERTVYYLHGGGYSFYPRATAVLEAIVRHKTRSQLFALDYRLSPEHPHPAQVEDALTGWRGLVSSGVNPQRLVIAGDSSGGNLVMQLLLRLRDEGLPQPALAVCLSPLVDMARFGDSFKRNVGYDMLEPAMVAQWRKWYLHEHSPHDPLVSPLRANLQGLSPIYIQAGQAELLIDQLKAFVEEARRQGADVTLDAWKDMTHDFQALGPLTRQSREALSRLRQVVDHYAPGQGGRKRRTA